MPARTASSTTYWMAGLSTTGSISLGCALVAGRKRVPRPAAGMTALVTAEEEPGVRLVDLIGRRPPMPARPAPGRLALTPLECQRPPTPTRFTMPTYEYRCKDCDHELEVVQSFTDAALTECPACGGTCARCSGTSASPSRAAASTRPTAAPPAAGARSKSDKKSDGDSARLEEGLVLPSSDSSLEGVVVQERPVLRQEPPSA